MQWILFIRIGQTFHWIDRTRESGSKDSANCGVQPKNAHVTGRALEQLDLEVIHRRFSQHGSYDGANRNRPGLKSSTNL